MTARKIDAPGVYALPMDEYHGDCCSAPSISGSGLFTIDRYCPARYFATSYLNPSRTEDDDTPVFSVGKAAHSIIIEGDEAFARDVAVMPEDMDLRTKAGKEWNAEQAEAGKTVIRWKQWLAIRAMVDAFRAHPMAARAFANGSPEQSLIWQDAETGIWLKARPDWTPTDSRFLPNYKTAICAKPADFSRAAFAYGYHQSAAMVIDAARVVLGIDNPAHYWIVQEKDPPYLVTLYTMSDDAIEWGRIINRAALATFARCVKRGEWPGYADTAVQLEMPAWAERQLERRSEAGDFASPEIQPME